MSIRITAQVPSISAALKTAEIVAAMKNMKAMARASDDLKGRLRDQVAAAGFSDRLAKTWQGKVYPSTGQSLAPAAYVFSKAPKIIDAFARGATIVATGGRRLLAIPTEDAPRVRSGKAETPAQVEERYGRKLRFVPAHSAQGSAVGGRAVGYLIMDGLVPRKQTGRYRKASAKELAGNGRTAGRRVSAVVMFTLVPRVKMPKLFDLQATADSVAASVPQLIAEEWSR